MSKLLINEPPLQVLPSLAVYLGLNEAIFIQQVHYWVQNPKMGKNADGQKWIRMSIPEWVDQFPFWSDAVIRRTMRNLEQDGLLIIRNDLNRHGYDETNWFGINYGALNALDTAVPRIADKQGKRLEALEKARQASMTPSQDVTPLQDVTPPLTECEAPPYKMEGTIPKITSKTTSEISVSEPPVDEAVEITWGMIKRFCGGDESAAAAVWQLQEAFCESSGIPRPNIDTEAGRSELESAWWPKVKALLDAANGDLESAREGVKTAVTEMIEWKASSVTGPWSIQKKIKGVLNAQRRAAAAPAAAQQNATYQHLNAVPVGKLLGM